MKFPTITSSLIWLIAFVAAIFAFFVPNSYSVLALNLSIILLLLNKFEAIFYSNKQRITQILHTALDKTSNIMKYLARKIDTLNGSVSQNTIDSKQHILKGLVQAIMLTIILLVLACVAIVLESKFTITGLSLPEIKPRAPGHNYVFFVGLGIFVLYFLQARRWVVAGLLVFVALFWQFYIEAVRSYLKLLGIDSLIETQDPEFQIVLFWFQTVKQLLIPIYSAKVIAINTLLTFLVYFFLVQTLNAFDRTRKFKKGIIFGFGYFILVVGIVQSFSDPIKVIISSSKNFLAVQDQYSSSPIPESVVDKKPMKVLVYIGESTNSLQMSLYGYHRKTTPQLDALREKTDQLLVFNNVFSPHTHTTPSLSEALSIGMNPDEEYVPSRQKRVTIVDILQKTGIPTTLYNNQGRSGSWNRTSPILFRNATKIHSSETQFAGNKVSHIDLLFDHEFIERFIHHSGLKNNSKELVVFHSSAGHGHYKNYVPPSFHAPIDSLFESLPAVAVMGRKSNWYYPHLDNYDSMIPYVDGLVVDSIENTEALPYPAVFIYFSDHGESPYTARGHDSSRFIFEMATIPMVLYFNTHAKNAYPELFNQYSAASQENWVFTLRQFPHTILDLFGGKFTNSAIEDIEPPLHQPAKNREIVFRQTANEITLISLDKECCGKNKTGKFNIVDKADGATKIYNATRYSNAKRGTIICSHRNNSVARAVRSSMAANCIETDIVARDDGSVAVYHPPAEDVGLDLDTILSIAQNRGNSLWLDGKNLTKKEACSALAKTLQKSNYNAGTLLIEFSSNSFQAKESIAPCITILKQKGYAISYYVPTSLAKACSESLQKSIAFNSVPSCTNLKKNLQQAAASNLYTDFSFDYRGIQAMKQTASEQNSSFKKYQWNTWNVKPEMLEKIQPERFRMIILAVPAGPNAL